MENKQKISFGEFMLYAGSKDERVRSAADKGGHITFHILLALSFIDLFVRGIFLQCPIEQTWFTMVILFGGAALYTIQWIIRGVTYLDTKKQTSTYRKFIIGAGIFVVIITTIIIYFNLSKFGEWASAPWWIWLFPLGGGALTIVLSTILVRIFHNLGKARAEKLADKNP